jgi:hypothetical protein
MKITKGFVYIKVRNMQFYFSDANHLQKKQMILVSIKYNTIEEID